MKQHIVVDKSDLFSIQTAIGNNLTKQKREEIIEQLSTMLLNYIKSTIQSPKNNQEDSHASSNNN